MSLILCIETSSKNCSVALSDNGQIISFQEELDDNYCHAKKLHVLIEQVLKNMSISINQIDAFCFSAGPGSYTGLRIGASAIKGFSVALDKPVIIVSTLKSMVWGILNTQFKKEKMEDVIFCPTLDSRQGEVYAAMYDANFIEHLEPFACNVIDFSFSDFLENKKMYFFGLGTHKLQSIITHKNAFLIEDFFPSARYLGHFAQMNFDNNNFVDVAYFEPLYLKPFIPTKPKNK